MLFGLRESLFVRNAALWIIFSGLVIAPGWADSRTGQQHDPDEGMEGSVRLGIPEPMVFDLVRPLGAAKGEFEVNSLFRPALRAGDQTLWAPEVEYAFLHGTAIDSNYQWQVRQFKTTRPLCSKRFQPKRSVSLMVCKASEK